MKLTFAILAILVTLCAARTFQSPAEYAYRQKFFDNSSPLTQTVEFKIVSSVPNLKNLNYLYHLEGDRNLEVIQTSAQI